MEKWKNTNASFDASGRQDLIGQMTLEEKVSQMVFTSSALSRFGTQRVQLVERVPPWGGPGRGGHGVSPGHRHGRKLP